MEIWTSLSTTLGDTLAKYGLLAIFVVMLLKEFGIPVPVPSDLIMIVAGVQAKTGVYTLIDLLIAIEIALLIGSSVKFLIVRTAGRQFVYHTGRFFGLTPSRLDRAGAMLRARGALAVFLGLNVPGARAAIVPAAGLAGMAYRAFLPAMVAGSTLFYGWHVALGYIIGPSATTLLEGAHLPLALAFLAFAALGLVGWLVLRGRRQTKTMAEGGAIARLHSWTEAACPACLAATALQQLSTPSTGP